MWKVSSGSERRVVVTIKKQIWCSLLNIFWKYCVSENICLSVMMCTSRNCLNKAIKTYHTRHWVYLCIMFISIYIMLNNCFFNRSPLFRLNTSWKWKSLINDLQKEKKWPQYYITVHRLSIVWDGFEIYNLPRWCRNGIFASRRHADTLDQSEASISGGARQLLSLAKACFFGSWLGVKIVYMKIYLVEGKHSIYTYTNFPPRSCDLK